MGDFLIVNLKMPGARCTCDAFCPSSEHSARIAA